MPEHRWEHAIRRLPLHVAVVLPIASSGDAMPLSDYGFHGILHGITTLRFHS
jgi:hypothetical protein